MWYFSPFYTHICFWLLGSLVKIFDLIWIAAQKFLRNPHLELCCVLFLKHKLCEGYLYGIPIVNQQYALFYLNYLFL